METASTSSITSQQSQIQTTGVTPLPSAKSRLPAFTIKKNGESIPQLYVNVLEAQNLDVTKNNGRLMCNVCFGNNNLMTDSVNAKSNPKWHEEFLFYVAERVNVKLEIYLTEFSTEKTSLIAKSIRKVKEKKKALMEMIGRKQETRKMLIGEVQIPISKLGNSVLDDWYTLSAPSTKGDIELADLRDSDEVFDNNLGRIHLKMQLSNDTMDSQSKLQQPQFTAFLQLLTAPDFSLVSALCDVIDVADGDKLSPLLIRVFSFRTEIRSLMEFIVRKEVSATSTVNILFRSNSIAMKLVSAYAKMIGTTYLQKVLSPLIKEVVNGNMNPNDYEVDPSRLKGGNVNENVSRLSELVLRFVDAIISSADILPRPIREVCCMLKTAVSERFDEFSLTAVGGFIFLRFLCPACMAPESFKLLEEPPQQDKRRILILVVKILQNMANRVDFGAKETFMAPFNALISSTSPKLFSFLTTISDVKLLPKLDKKNDIKFEGSGSILKSEGGSMIGSMTKGEGSIIKGEGSIIKDGSILKAENVARGDVIMVNMEELLNDLLSIHKLLSVNLKRLVDNQSQHKVDVVSLEQLLDSIRKDSDNANAPAIAYGNYTRRLVAERALKIQSQHHFDLLWTLQQQAQSEITTEDDLILNSYWTGVGETRDFCVVVYELVQSLLHTFQKHDGKWGEIRSSADFEKFEKQVSELSIVQLYAGYDALLSFWINLYNLLVLHIHVLYGPPANGQQWKTMKSQLKYKIGNHLFSLNDIMDGILRGNQKNKFTRHRHFRGGDYRRTLTLKPLDKRIHFALSDLTHNSPSIRLYTPSSVDEQLQHAAESFLSKHLHINLEKNTIVLPQVFESYSSDFEFEKREELLIWVFQFLSSRKRLDLMLLLEGKNYHLQYSNSSSTTTPGLSTFNSAIINTVYEVQSTLKWVWGELSMSSDLTVCLWSASIVKEVDRKLRDYQKLQPNRQTQLISPPTLLQIHALSADQKKAVSKEKQDTFLKFLQTIGLTVQEIITILNSFVIQLSQSPSADLAFVELLSQLRKKVIEIENKLVEVNGWRGDEVHETRRAQFDLLQAIASEAVDISHINKLLLSQLSQLDPKKPEDQLLIMTIASIVRYSKTQLEVSNDSEMLVPLSLSEEDVKLGEKGQLMSEKLASLRDLTKMIIQDYIQKKLRSVVDSLPVDTSSKHLIILATKIRNIRNALRFIKGKRAKSLAAEKRLTVKILDASKAQSLQRELDEERLKQLESALQLF